MEKVSGDKKKVKELQQQIDKYELYSFVTTHKKQMMQNRQAGKEIRFREKMKILRLRDKKQASVFTSDHLLVGDRRTPRL